MTTHTSHQGLSQHTGDSVLFELERGQVAMRQPELPEPEVEFEVPLVGLQLEEDLIDRVSAIKGLMSKN